MIKDLRLHGNLGLTREGRSEIRKGRELLEVEN